MALAAVATRIEQFGPYIGRFTTAADIPDVLSALRDKEGARNPSKRQAVYLRQEDLVAQQVEHGFCFRVDRIAANDAERQKLGFDKQLVAMTMAYPLGITKDRQQQVMIPIEKAQSGRRARLFQAWEIGSSLYLKHRDPANANGLRPRGCFYDTIVGASMFNMFVRADEVGAEALVASVQSHLTSVIGDLTGAPLNWSIVKNPAQELVDSMEGTTRGDSTDEVDSNFVTHPKQYYAPTYNAFPSVATFLSNLLKRGKISYDRGDIKNIVQFDLQLPHDFQSLLPVVAKHPGFFKKREGTGLRELRVQLNSNLPEDTDAGDSGGGDDTPHNGTGGAGSPPVGRLAAAVTDGGLGATVIKRYLRPIAGGLPRYFALGGLRAT